MMDSLLNPIPPKEETRMILHNGETVYLSFTSAGNLADPPRAWVTEAVVLDAERMPPCGIAPAPVAP